MKHTLLTLSAIALSLGTSVAGPAGYSGKAPKAPVAPPMNVPSLCDCFDANTTFVSVYASALLADSDGHLDDGFGGGISLSHFFNANVGVEADANWNGTDGTVHLLTGSVVLRAPITEACLAPYALLGGGMHANGVTQGVWHAGAGLDVRFDACFGVFADARYTWTEEDSDYTIVRGGVRFNF